MDYYLDGVLVEHHDDTTQTVTLYSVGGTVTRKYTVAEVAQAAVEASEVAQIIDLRARIAALEALVVGHLPTATVPPTLAILAASQAGAVYAGQQITWSDGNVWACIVGPLNSTATPTTYPQGWAQKGGLPAVISAWSGASVAYKVGDLVSYLGATYRCIQAHTSQPGWTPAAVASIWTKQ
jgi:hypothetical protein